MKEPQRTRAPVPAAVPYVLVAAAILGGFVTLLAAAAHPVAVTAALAGVAVGALAGRAKSRLESSARRLAEAGEDAADPRPDLV